MKHLFAGSKSQPLRYANTLPDLSGMPKGVRKQPHLLFPPLFVSKHKVNAEGKQASAQRSFDICACSYYRPIEKLRHSLLWEEDLLSLRVLQEHIPPPVLHF